jgi:hypothetical protein
MNISMRDPPIQIVPYALASVTICTKRISSMSENLTGAASFLGRLEVAATALEIKK